MKMYCILCFAQSKALSKQIFNLCFIVFLLQIIFQGNLWGKPSAPNQTLPDSIQTALQKQLQNTEFLQKLNFPKTVGRFYALNAQKSAWLASEQNVDKTNAAMLLLDCVRQFGLQHVAYHPEVLTYPRMYEAIEANKNTSSMPKVEFEIMLTDAMISMINHLHFGAYNPDVNDNLIDNGLSDNLKAEYFLQNVILSNDLFGTILSVQPQSDQYKKLQGYMKLIAGQYTCDSYETPEGEARKIAMNMERLRWVNLEQSSYLHINVPSFKLVYKKTDSVYMFKVVVGKIITQTPTLQSKVYLIETAPDWNIPSNIFIKELLPKAIKQPKYFETNQMAVYDSKENIIPINKITLAAIKANPKAYHLRQSAGCENALGKVIFRFANNYGIYLHDTPEQQYFKREARALSHGCIRIEHADKLAELLLQSDDQQKNISLLNTAMKTYAKSKFKLNEPIPIIITYLTYTVEDGLLVNHKDIYNLDDALERKMYTTVLQVTKN
ncbi:MAG: L,D-transpeptidase [Pedobacter sp.]|nr:MAG: L,D-transpeptidase [Pedobacter sp.]